MARYTGPDCKLCRREGIKLYLKGDRCWSKKCAIERRGTKPGQHGQARARKQSEYGVQLREKQKARRMYGVLEHQFSALFEEADRQPGRTGENLLRLLEMRLDNVVYRLGFASSRDEARQMVNHGHFEVNGHKADIPSYHLRANDRVQVRATSKGNEHFQVVQTELRRKTIPGWLSMTADTLSGTVITTPERSECAQDVNEQLIVEWYSR